MTASLKPRNVAILATDGVEQVEFESPRNALREAGFTTTLIAPKAKIRAWQHDKWGDTFPADEQLKHADSEDYDALVLPGGVMNPDNLRLDVAAIEFVRAFIETGKPVAAVCHGPWLLIEADVVRDRDVTSWPSLKTDLANAGARWVDREVVRDANLITSRKPGDLDAFNRELIALLSGTTDLSLTPAQIERPSETPSAVT